MSGRGPACECRHRLPARRRRQKRAAAQLLRSQGRQNRAFGPEGLSPLGSCPGAGTRATHRPFQIRQRSTEPDPGGFRASPRGSSVELDRWLSGFNPVHATSLCIGPRSLAPSRRAEPEPACRRGPPRRRKQGPAHRGPGSDALLMQRARQAPRPPRSGPHAGARVVAKQSPSRGGRFGNAICGRRIERSRTSGAPMPDARRSD